MKICSWNVNGFRAVLTKGFFKWFEEEDADLICLQETKAHPNQLDMLSLKPKGYDSAWSSAEKAGYSGVAVFYKKEPLSIREGIGERKFDSEGRILTLEYKDFTLINAYFPNTQPDHARLGFKLEFCDNMLRYCENLRKKGKNIILCGDYNVAHEEIDLANPKSNRDNAGFLPEERAWMTKFLKHEYTDLFRHFTKEGGQYTWWSYRAGVRARNVGWRIDYFTCNSEFTSRVKSCTHRPEVMGSDHCPVVIKTI